MTKLINGERYKGRTADTVSINLSFDRETAVLLNERAPTKKARSAFLTRLLYAEEARREERRRLQTLLAGELSTAEEEGSVG